MTYFAAFDVDTPEEHEEIIDITSSEAQRVYISAYTYDPQHIRNGECDN